MIRYYFYFCIFNFFTKIFFNFFDIVFVIANRVFVFLFSLYGIENFQALAFAWLAYGLTLSQGILGGIVFALRKERRVA